MPKSLSVTVGDCAGNCSGAASAIGYWLTVMYQDFHANDPWSGEDLHCQWTANVVAIATRHADAVDIRFQVNGRGVWIAIPCTAWVEYKRKTGHVITDRLAAQAAGRFLKHAIEQGYDNGRDLYTMTIAEALYHVYAVMDSAGHTRLLPVLPVISG